MLGNPNEIKEVKNSVQAYDLLLSLNPYAENDLLKAHRLMMQDLVKRNGKYRKDGVGIFDGEKIVHLAPLADRVPALMSDLFAWLPVETLVKERQKEYYNALGASERDANSTRFIEFMLSLIANAIEENIKAKQKVTLKVTAKVTANQQKIIDAIKTNPFVTQDELADIVGIARKNIIANMKKLQESGLIKRVGADKNGHWQAGK